MLGRRLARGWLSCTLRHCRAEVGRAQDNGVECSSSGRPQSRGSCGWRYPEKCSDGRVESGGGEERGRARCRRATTPLRCYGQTAAQDPPPNVPGLSVVSLSPDLSSTYPSTSAQPWRVLSCCATPLPPHCSASDSVVQHAPDSRRAATTSPSSILQSCPSASLAVLDLAMVTTT